MSEKQEDRRIEEEPDILIQDLEDIPETTEVEEPLPEHLCKDCDAPIPDEEDYCDDCKENMKARPVTGGAVLGVVLTVFLSLAALFLFGINALIAHPVSLGNRALEEDDIKSCYAHYAESNSVAMRLNDLLFPDSNLTLFTNGTNTLIRQIIALDRLNGPYQAGQAVMNFFPLHTPKQLRSIQTTYKNLGAFVEEMQKNISEYQKSLPSGKTGDYDEMIRIVDQTAKKLPDTPDYMVEYYRFSVSYSIHTDKKRTAEHLDRLQKMAPDALWLYASEGIRAYNDAGEYKKSLVLCNRLMAKDASNPATIAYTMQVLRLLREYDKALAVYEKALTLTNPSSEMERQRAILLMLQGDTETAQKVLVASYSPQTANLEHVATIAVCAFLNEDTALYQEYKALLDSYLPFADVDALENGETTLEDIFLSDGGEIQ